jgi:hypothetical protein
VTIPQVIPEWMPGAGPFTVPGDFYLEVPTGVTGPDGNASTPDHPSLDIVGDIDIRVEVTLDDWSPTSARWLVSKYDSVGVDERSYLFYLNTNGLPAFQWSTNGTSGGLLFSTSGVSLADTVGRLALRFTLDVNDGSGNRVGSFYTAPSINGAWTLLDTDIVAGTTSIHSGAAVLEVGNSLDNGTTGLGGRIHAMELRSSIGGTIVADPDFTVQPPGTPSFVDSTGKTWTVNAAAAIDGFDWEAIPDEVIESTVRQRLQSLTWEVGRSNELDRFPPAPGTAVFRSNDRLLDPEYTSGDFFGLLLPRVPVRFRTVDPAADLYYGFPEDGWRQAYDKPYASRCTIDMVDLLGVISEMPLPQSAYDAEVLADNPKAFWKLDESEGTQMADSSGNGRHGIYDNGLLGQDPLVFGDGNSVEFPNVGDNRGRWTGEGLPEGAPCTLEAWVQTTRDTLLVKTIIAVQRDATLSSVLWFQIAPAAQGSPNGELVIYFGIGSAPKFRGHTRIDDNRPHHVVCTIDGTTASDIQLYVDGVIQTKTLHSGSTPAGPWTHDLAWTVGNIIDSGSGEWGFDGLVDEVAVYDYILSADRIAAHYEAGTSAFDGDSTGARINRVLDIIGVPEALRDIGVGDTTVGPATYGGDTVGSYLNKVVESEQGVLFVDHPGGGKLKFRGRYARLTEARSTTSQATFTDDLDTVDGWCYRNDIAPEPNGMASVVNSVDIQWRGGTELVAADDSITRYGPKNRTLTTEAPTPQAARSAGLWLLGRYSEPQSRIRRLPLGPGGGQTGLDAVVLGQQISDRITVERHPQRIGSVITNELIVEGIRNEMNPDGSWYATYNTSNADDTQVWIWGVSTWGETTAWG